MFYIFAPRNQKRKGHRKAGRRQRWPHIERKWIAKIRTFWLFFLKIRKNIRKLAQIVQNCTESHQNARKKKQKKRPKT